jgi:hypothetical protein
MLGVVTHLFKGVRPKGAGFWRYRSEQIAHVALDLLELSPKLAIMMTVRGSDSSVLTFFVIRQIVLFLICTGFSCYCSQKREDTRTTERASK